MASEVSQRGSEKQRRPSFPARIYQDTVLEEVFASAKRYFLLPLLEVEYAHTLMLARQGIMPRAEAARCFRALDELDLESIRRTSYDGTFEDLFFLIEQRLAAMCGSEVSGKMHTARSRNDIDLTMYRMVLREMLLRYFEALLDLRSCLVDIAWTQRASLMPAYTHNQPAQPTTLGHYLMACIEVLERDSERVAAAFGRVNRSPLGACAITTTGFPIDRQMTERLLGFEGMQVNSYGAIAAVDYLTESCSVIAVAMVSLGRFVQDLLLWSTAEFGYLRLSDAYVQISSIMPQKRNPVPLEHVRILASKSLYHAQGVLGSLHNTPFADSNDAEDQLQPMAYASFEDAIRGIKLLSGVLEEAEFNVERMAEAASSHFLSVTELADTLVRTTGTSFHEAHEMVSSAVRALDAAGKSGDTEALADLIEGNVRGQSSEPAISREQIGEALSPQHFVKVRRRPGGPSLEVLEPEIVRARELVGRDRAWVESKWYCLNAAQNALREGYAELMREAE